MTTDVYVVDAVHTPIGRYGGALAGIRIGVGQGLAVVLEAC